MKGQSHRASLCESLFNVAVGYGINVAALGAMAPCLGASRTLAIGVAMTFISVGRSYFLRRFFNWLHCGGYATLRSLISWRKTGSGPCA